MLSIGKWKCLLPGVTDWFLFKNAEPLTEQAVRAACFFFCLGTTALLNFAMLYSCINDSNTGTLAQS